MSNEIFDVGVARAYITPPMGIRGLHGPRGIANYRECKKRCT